MVKADKWCEQEAWIECFIQYVYVYITVYLTVDSAASVLLEYIWRISLYVTDDVFAKLCVT